jgi:hypothetical protein
MWLGLLLWNGQNLYATIGKGLISRDKDMSGTHVFDPKQEPGGPQWHSTYSRKICVIEF